MLEQITAPPRAISADAHAELTSSTPANFADIPPVLRWEDDADVVVSSGKWRAWPLEAATSQANGESAENAEGELATSAKMSGRVYVTDDVLAFLPANGPGFSLPFPQLSLHALTPAAADRGAHIYCQIDEGGEDDEEYTAMGEVRIYVPQDKLEPLFNALSSASAAHASAQGSGDAAQFFGLGGEWITGEDGAFDDAEDEDDDEGGAGRPTYEDKLSRFLSKVNWGGVSSAEPMDERSDTPTAANAAEEAEFVARMARWKEVNRADGAGAGAAGYGPDGGGGYGGSTGFAAGGGTGGYGATGGGWEMVTSWNGWEDRAHSEHAEVERLRTELAEARERIRALEARLAQVGIDEADELPEVAMEMGDRSDKPEAQRDDGPSLKGAAVQAPSEGRAEPVVHGQGQGTTPSTAPVQTATAPTKTSPFLDR